VQFEDLSASPFYAAGDPLTQAIVDIDGGRTTLSVPLVRDDEVLGVITAVRREVRPFSERQIALLKNFAGQAVVAMANARLITETREALEQQTATAEVLQVINASPGDVAPVFEAMVERAARLCEADEALVRICDGEALRLAAVHGGDAESREKVRQLGPTGFTGGYEPFARGERIVHLHDVREIAASRLSPADKARLEARRIRTWLGVALRKDDTLLGIINVHRREVRPFSDRQIALLQNFAAQAVIAMENARLITETREALEQQIATAEVLGVINSSPGDLVPVFDAMLEKAMRICDAAFGQLAVHADSRFRTAATRGMPPAFVEYRRNNPPDFGPQTLPGRLLAGARVLHVADLKAEAAYQDGEPNRRALVDLGGVRTAVMVPLLHDGTVRGFISIYRQEVRPFGDKQIALLQNFAAQAVIAIENARLLTETREALEQQTATAEVLGVNAHPGDLAPVFEALMDHATRLCEGAFGDLWIHDGTMFRLAAVRGAPPAFAEFLARAPETPGSAAHRRLLAGDRLYHVPDLTDDEAHRSGNPMRRAVVELGGARAVLAIPLRKDATLLGVFSVFRQEVRPFTDKQSALLENFAAQAVIAIENTRLITETREALEKQTATAEILSVISSSPTDVQPTFEAIAARAALLCDVVHAAVFRFDGSLIHMGAMYGVTGAEREASDRTFPLPPGRTSATTRAIENREVVHIPDVKTDPEYTPNLHVFGTALSVPMLHDGVPMGAITVTRPHVERLSDAQIELLKTFADQAVIAIQNVRLFKELNERTRDLEESLDYQTATSDVLKVISGSSFDLQPVFDTIGATATRLCGSEGATISIREGEVFRYVSAYALDDEYWAALRQRTIVPGRETVHGRVALEGRVVHIEDITTDPDYESPETVRAGGRTILGVPLLREGTVVGAISMGRSRVEPYTERQIELVRTFADQAVIAIENARLINEIRERTDDLQVSLEYQTPTSDVLKVISRSTFDLQSVLDTVCETAAHLWGADGAGLTLREGGAIGMSRPIRSSRSSIPTCTGEPFRPSAAAWSDERPSRPRSYTFRTSTPILNTRCRRRRRWAKRGHCSARRCCATAR
jgi:GAF domain-containing protein